MDSFISSNSERVHDSNSAHSSPDCPDADKHDAIAASLQRLLDRLNLPDTNALLFAIITTDAFLRPWVEYRDLYLLHPSFNDEGLCAGGERIDELFRTIQWEVCNPEIITPLGEHADGRAHTVRCYSSLIAGLTGWWFSNRNVRTEDGEWVKKMCKELYALVKHLRIEYVLGHGVLMDAIEEEYPSPWLHAPPQAEGELSHSGDYEDANLGERGPVSEAEIMMPGLYFRGFTQSASSSQASSEDVDGNQVTEEEEEEEEDANAIVQMRLGPDASTTCFQYSGKMASQNPSNQLVVGSGTRPRDFTPHYSEVEMPLDEWEEAGTLRSTGPLPSNPPTAAPHTSLCREQLPPSYAQDRAPRSRLPFLESDSSSEGPPEPGGGTATQHPRGSGSRRPRLA